MEKQFTNKNIAVLGFGIEGKSTVNFLLKQGATVTVYDEKTEDKFENAELKEFREKGVEFHLGGLPGSFEGFHVVVRSPGIKLDKVQKIIARKSKIKNQSQNLNEAIITSPTKIFFDLCPSRIIGVTGTKGKGTTSSLVYEMLKLAGKDVYLGGNIGTPPLDFLDKLHENSWVVLELSSFQLQDLHKSPHIAVMLMVTSEHLDYHKDTSEYVDAKRNILRFQSSEDFAVVNRDYPASRESDIYTEGNIFQVSREDEVTEGCFVKEGKVVIKFPISNDELKHRKLTNNYPKTENREQITEIIDTKDILLPGRHNLENVCAAVMSATLAGVTKQNIVKVLKTFKGLEHRLELVDIVKGVRFYDDSFSTTPETAQAAIEAFSEPEVLILGGSGKGSDFSHLGKAIVEKENIKAIIGIGVEWERIKAQLKVQPFGSAQGESAKFKVIEGCKDMKEIARAAFDTADFGDVIILSPACASFDMFKNYKDRGEQFKQEVLKLKSQNSNRKSTS